MKIWLSKNSEIPVREQLVAQVTLGIVSGDLPSGERLPSTREISRRFQIHANTVAAAYKKLVEKNLIEFRTGSGFYVFDREKSADGKLSLDALAAEFFRAAQSLGFSRDEIFESLKNRFEKRTAGRILVVEPDADLRRILIEEIERSIDCAVSGTGYEELENKFRASENQIIAAMPNEKPKLETVLPSSFSARVYLTPRSVSGSMHGESRPEKDDLIAVASAWESFLTLAKTVLVAANIDNDSIITRSTKQANWRKGLENASLVICDALAAKTFGGEDERVRPFHLIADASLAELKELVGTIDER